MRPAEDYILQQEEPYRSMLLHLQLIIERTIANVELQYKYKVPFYYVEGRPFCYLNVPKKKSYVDLGFWNSAHLSVHQELLCTSGRKMMKSLRYTEINEINEAVLVAVLLDAYAVKDKKFWK